MAVIYNWMTFKAPQTPAQTISRVMVCHTRATPLDEFGVFCSHPARRRANTHPWKRIYLLYLTTRHKNIVSFATRWNLLTLSFCHYTNMAAESPPARVDGSRYGILLRNTNIVLWAQRQTQERIYCANTRFGHSFAYCPNYYCFIKLSANMCTSHPLLRWRLQEIQIDHVWDLDSDGDDVDDYDN